MKGVHKRMFNIGDKIVYPMHGAGVIESIEEKELAGEKQAYYILRMPGEVKVMVPVEKALEVGVRDIIDKETAGNVIQVFDKEDIQEDPNWNRRYRENMEKMKSGDIYEIANIVRTLSFKQKEKGLSTGDKKMLLNAKQILISELVLAEQSDKEHIEELIDNKINLSYIKSSTNKLEEDETPKNVVNKFIPFDM